MPFKMYSSAEVEAMIRLAWATGVRDCLEQWMGEKMDAEAIARLAQLTDSKGRLSKMVESVQTAGAQVALDRALTTRELEASGGRI